MAWAVRPLSSNFLFGGILVDPGPIRSSELDGQFTCEIIEGKVSEINEKALGTYSLAKPVPDNFPAVDWLARFLVNQKKGIQFSLTWPTILYWLQIICTKNLKDLFQPCRLKSVSAPPEAIWAQFKPKKVNQKATTAHAEAHFSPWDQISSS